MKNNKDGSLPGQILLGDCLDILRTLNDSSIDSLVTDPPYGLGTKEPSVGEILAYLKGEELDTGGDIMGKNWAIPSIETWKECFRVLKPGGHVLCFGGTRTFDLVSLGLRAAGFQARDTITAQLGSPVLQWVQGQGFPKSTSITKAYARGKATPEGDEKIQNWEGWGTALKPSWEPILVYRKPFNGTIVQNALQHGTGGINIDECRIGGPGGRWPTNFLLTHNLECEMIGLKKVKAPVINRFNDGMKPFGEGAGHTYTSQKTGDQDGMEEIPVYKCTNGCPVKALAEQNKDAPKFFNQFKYEKKVGKKEKGPGNNHPTVKPLDLMKWLVQLVTPADGTVLDPYCGSGTTCLAASHLGRQYIGIEKDPTYYKIASNKLLHNKSNQ